MTVSRSRKAVRGNVRISGWALLWLAFCPPLAIAEEPSAERRPAVAAPNVRMNVAYDFSHVDDARVTFVSPTEAQTLLVGETGIHSATGEIVATLPVFRALGFRAALRGGYGLGRSEIDSAGIEDDFEVGAYGASSALFLRDPSLGSVSAGAAFDRVENGDGSNEDRIGGVGSITAYFPDLGAGPVDWGLGFRYEHASLSSAGPDLEDEGDSYAVGGSAGWYVSSRSLVELGGFWVRQEAGSLVNEDRMATMGLRWLVPIEIVSTEIGLTGTVGESEFKLAPFTPDDRLKYSIKVGIQIRQIRGKTLVELRRGYD